jgi:hypothetical protein
MFYVPAVDMQAVGGSIHVVEPSADEAANHENFLKSLKSPIWAEYKEANG